MPEVGWGAPPPPLVLSSPGNPDGPRRVPGTDPAGRGRDFQDGGVSFRAGAWRANERRGADGGGACARVRRAAGRPTQAEAGVAGTAGRRRAELAAGLAAALACQGVARLRSCAPPSRSAPSRRPVRARAEAAVRRSRSRSWGSAAAAAAAAAAAGASRRVPGEQRRRQRVAAGKSEHLPRPARRRSALGALGWSRCAEGEDPVLGPRRLLLFLERLTCLNRLEPGMRMSVGSSLPLPLWGRTFLLLLSVAVTQSHWPSEPSEAVRDWENQLEASMHSALSDLHEAVPTVVGIPDGTAVVGRSFRVTIPTDLIASNGEVIKVSAAGKEALPSWLHWDLQSHTLEGLPLDTDKGVHYISVSAARLGANGSHVPQTSSVFSIEVYPEDHSEPQSLRAASPDPGEVVSSVCAADEPVTVLTVILDADLTKMTPKQRIDLLRRMRGFSEVEPHNMKLVPVVNNRLFDMSAFMAGPGNAKKVVENGALLSWKLGCALNQNSVPDIRGVEVPARKGTMSAQLGYPVVGWHIANKKPPLPKRIRRQIHATPTPVTAIGPPTTAIQEPPSRIVPTPTSPAIAPPTETMAPPVRDPVPGKPTVTIRTRGAIIQTPTLGPIQPTRVSEAGTTVPSQIRPTMTIPGYVEPTAVITPPTMTTKKPRVSTPRSATPSTDSSTTTTRRPTKKPRTSRPVPRVTTKAPITRLETASPPTRIRTTTSGVPHGGEPNQRPELKNHIDRVDAWVGTYFEVKIPSDTFYDNEDTTTDKLKLTLKLREQQLVGEKSWVQFNSNSQLMYGLPDSSHVGKHEYFMHATDKGGLSAVDAFEIHVHRRPQGDKAPARFKAKLTGDPAAVTNDIHKKIALVKKLAFAFGDRNCSTITLQNITRGSIVVEWTNNTLPLEPCPKEQITALSRRIAEDDGKPRAAFVNALEPDFQAMSITVTGSGSCRHLQFVPVAPPRRVPSEAPATEVPDRDPEKSSEDDVYLHTVIPAVVVAAILLIAGIIAMICYRKKRKGKLTLEDQATFIKKGVPIIFADELDDSKPPPSSSMPLILQEEKAPLPPPEYPNQSVPETTPLNQDTVGEYAPLRDEDPSAPPYQPPPPFTAPMEGKGSRPKNMTPYRSPPPYVPP